MAETGNYQLKQWEKTDRIQMEDFNADNAKTDQALARQRDDLVALTAAVALCGNCKMVYGSYTGTGKYGSANPNQLSFAHKPILVLVQCTASEDDTDRKLRMMRGITWAVGTETNYSWGNTVIWSANSVSWYNVKGPSTQFNFSGSTYHYLALLLADE